MTQQLPPNWKPITGFKLLYKNLEETAFVISKCLKSKFLNPSLILIYSTIDLLAWLNCPESKLDVQRSDFTSWVDKYLLPESSLRCTSLELYAARCGIVHCHSAESRLTRTGEARKICYTTGPADEQILQGKIDRIGSGDEAVAVNAGKLFNSLLNGIQQFSASLLKDPDLSKRAKRRTEQFFTSIPQL